MNRREALAVLGTTAAALTLHAEEPKAKARFKQSLCRWCYGRIDLDKLAEEAARIGYRSIELLGPDEIRRVKKHGLTCAVMRCQSGIVNGLNRVENHEKILKELREDIDFAAAEGIPNVLTMSGNRAGMDDEQGLKNCAAALKQIVGYAEEKKVTILMEGLNSKIDHKDYMYDKTDWGVRLCQAVGSPRFKLLYDIYHMQIMEGDVIRTIRTHIQHIGHFHTGGNPGRNEIDESQELNYPAIMRAIAATGFDGYVGQEFIPTRDPFASLAQAYRICDV
ncbi:MAG: TIM barrel protein [Gemmataceae bacterium]|nr:TIM barrel protein [Gemmataceae bacterium]